MNFGMRRTFLVVSFFVFYSTQNLPDALLRSESPTSTVSTESEFHDATEDVIDLVEFRAQEYKAAWEDELYLKQAIALFEKNPQSIAIVNRAVLKFAVAYRNIDIAFLQAYIDLFIKIRNVTMFDEELRTALCKLFFNCPYTQAECATDIVRKRVKERGRSQTDL